MKCQFQCVDLLSRKIDKVRLFHIIMFDIYVNILFWNKSGENLSKYIGHFYLIYWLREIIFHKSSKGAFEFLYSWEEL